MSEIIRTLRFILAETMMSWTINVLPEGESKNHFCILIKEYLEMSINKEVENE